MLINIKVVNNNIESASVVQKPLVNIGVSTNTAFQCEHKTYMGDYTVTPKAHEEQILDTKGKAMADDVHILQVPFYKTSNQTGHTIYIASEV